MSTQSRDVESSDTPDASVPPASKLARLPVSPDSDPASLPAPAANHHLAGNQRGASAGTRQLPAGGTAEDTRRSGDQRYTHGPRQPGRWQYAGKSRRRADWRDGSPSDTRRIGVRRYGETRQLGSWWYEDTGRSRDQRYGRIAARWRWWRTKRLKGLWRRPDFLKLWAGQTVSIFGTLITGVALPLTAIYALRATPAEVALLSAANVAPGLALGLFAGVWVDRLRRRPILIAADVGRALALGSVPVAALLGALTIQQLYVVALLTSALTVCFESAYPAYLPSLLARDELVEGNSKLTASASVAEVAGFGLGGALVQALTGPIAIGVDALTYVVSAVSLLLIRHREAASAERGAGPTDTQRGWGQQAWPLDERSRDAPNRMAPPADGLPLASGWVGEPLSVAQSDLAPAVVVRAEPNASATSLWRELGVGLRYTLGTPIPRALALMSAITRMCGSVVEVVLALYLVRELHVPPLVIGLIWGVGGATSFVGAALAQRVIRRLGIGRAIVWSVFVASLCTIFIPLASGPLWLAVALMALQQFGDAAHTLYDIGTTSVLQAQTPPRALGRLHATIQVIQGAANLIGLALGGALGQTIGLRPTLFVAALGMLLAPLVVALSPVRRLRDVGVEASA